MEVDPLQGSRLQLQFVDSLSGEVTKPSILGAHQSRETAIKPGTAWLENQNMEVEDGILLNTRKDRG